MGVYVRDATARCIDITHKMTLKSTTEEVPVPALSLARLGIQDLDPSKNERALRLVNTSLRPQHFDI